jgi:hypothetical protein
MAPLLAIRLMMGKPNSRHNAFKALAVSNTGASLFLYR